MLDADHDRARRCLWFPGALERAFQEEYYEQFRRALQLGQSAAVLIGIATALRLLVQGAPPVGVALFWGPLVTASLLGIALTFNRDFGRYWQPYFAATMLLAPLLFGVLAVGTGLHPELTDPRAKLHFFIERVLTMMVFNFAVLRLQLFWTALYQALIVAGSAWAALTFLRVPASGVHDEYATVILPTLGMLLLAAFALERAQRRAFLANRSLDAERARTESLLLRVLPGPIAERLKTGVEPIADEHAEATVLFADIADFTALAASRPASEVVRVLNEVFSRFDRITETAGLEKIKTIGDCYMAVAGAPTPRPDHAEAAARAALAMQAEARQLSAELGVELHLRVGIESGPLLGGVIGRKRFLYDVWGDTVNTASRLEAQGIPGTIQVSAEVARRLPPAFRLRRRGEIEIKGKGRMETYLVEAAAGAPDDGEERKEVRC